MLNAQARARVVAIITRSVCLVIKCDGVSSRAGRQAALAALAARPNAGGTGAISPEGCQTNLVRVYLGSDHAGFELKAAIIAWLGEAGHEAVDCGPARYDPQDDYPVYVLRAAQGTIRDPGSLGIVIGGSGNGEQIAANKVPGARAALAWNTETAKLSREHNNAQVVGIGARMHSVEEATVIVEAFLATPFSGVERHQRRIDILAEYERTGVAPELPTS